VAPPPDVDPSLGQDYVYVSYDTKNAFNAKNRRLIMEAVFACPELAPGSCICVSGARSPVASSALRVLSTDPVVHLPRQRPLQDTFEREWCLPGK
jgi:hypothetical protein